MTPAHRGRGEDHPAPNIPENEPAPEAPSSEIPQMDCHLIQINWTKENFERFKYTIIEFSISFINANKAKGLSVTRNSVVGYWHQLVWRLYGEGNATCTVLEAQVSLTYTYGRTFVKTDRVLYLVGQFPSLLLFLCRKSAAGRFKGC